MGIVIDTAAKEFTPSIKAAILFRIYESAEIRFIQKYLSGSMRVVELGSGLGITGAHILDVLAPGGKLTCVEANPSLTDVLARTMLAAQRRTGHEVAIVNGIISTVADRKDARAAPLAIGSSTLASRSPDTMVVDQSKATTMVPTVSLSSLVSGLDEYSLVVDIEGAEASLLAEEKAALSRATRMVIELHPTRYHSREISVADMATSLLDDHGFRLLDRRGPVFALAR